ncbi:unnamed protein product [Nyctereutes procyonoides]|uniref:(raccoon dog) hypothetical protein n=1 Tax=Nyctereutes procyonoides TaxID=34880 RepID=A0A811YCV4_NYCPR|nr:unnamed protein product [Nyctereutes procyonoides]
MSHKCSKGQASLSFKPSSSYKLGQNFNKEIENIKKTQLELKNTITQIKNTLEGISSLWKEVSFVEKS